MMEINKDDDRYEPTITQSSFKLEPVGIQAPIEQRKQVIPEGYVKVVRCKDCVFWSRYDNSLCRGECSWHHKAQAAWYFCADGVSRIHANGSIIGKGDETE